MKVVQHTMIMYFFSALFFTSTLSAAACSDQVAQEMVKRVKTGDISQVEALLGEESSKLGISRKALVNQPCRNRQWPLRSAIYLSHNSLEMTQYLLEQGANANQAETTEGITPLMFAVCSDKPDLIALLLEYGAQIEATDMQGRTALVYAFREDKPYMARLFAEEYSAQLQVTDHEGKTPLFYAIEKGKGYLAKFFVQKSLESGFSVSDIVNVKDNQGLTPLHVAASLKNIHMVKYLLSLGADVNSQDSHGRTPLHAAFTSIEGCYPTDVVIELVGWGANLQLKGKKYRGGGRQRIPKMAECWVEESRLVEGGKRKARLELALLKNPPSVYTDGVRKRMRMSIQSIVDAQYQLSFVPHEPLNSEQRRIVMRLKNACKPKEVASVRELFESAMSQGLSPEVLLSKLPIGDLLSSLVSTGRVDLIRYFLDLGASVNVFDRVGFTPFAKAVLSSYCSPEMINLFCEHGADVELASREVGQTPLSFAFEGHKFEVMDRLLVAGADYNVRNSQGKTLLYRAAEGAAKERESRVAYLILQGADPNIPDFNGVPPLHVVVKKGDWRTVKYLLCNGADVNALDCEGRNALHALLTCESWSVDTIYKTLCGFGIDDSVKAKVTVGDVCSGKNTPLKAAKSIVRKKKKLTKKQVHVLASCIRIMEHPTQGYSDSEQAGFQEVINVEFAEKLETAIQDSKQRRERRLNELSPQHQDTTVASQQEGAPGEEEKKEEGDCPPPYQDCVT